MECASVTLAKFAGRIDQSELRQMFDAFSDAIGAVTKTPKISAEALLLHSPANLAIVKIDLGRSSHLIGLRIGIVIEAKKATEEHGLSWPESKLYKDQSVSYGDFRSKSVERAKALGLALREFSR